LFLLVLIQHAVSGTLHKRKTGHVHE
jgi:hypothetical protein